MSGLVTEIKDTVAIIRFNRPATRNSLSQDFLNELETTLSGLLNQPGVNSLIFTGTGDVFASGADITELAQLTAETAYDFSKHGQALFQMIAGARQATIAAVNGYCMGGALDLALACDVRIASRQAVFAHPGARLGIITGWGGTQRLPRLIGRTNALEFFTTARRITSYEALELGLINEVADPVLDHAIVRAAGLPRIASPAL